MANKLLMSTAAHPKQHVIQVDSPLGPLAVGYEAGSIVSLDIGVQRGAKSRLTDPYANQIRAALKAYFSNPGYRIRLSLTLHGTPFQRRVWQALRMIPAGQTRTYGELAKQLHSSARAIGMACRANPAPVIVPCHRIVAANGLGGYAGKTAGRQLGIKRWLLQHEGVRFE